MLVIIVRDRAHHEHRGGSAARLSNPGAVALAWTRGQYGPADAFTPALGF
jgi:hypothetical protein